MENMESQDFIQTSASTPSGVSGIVEKIAKDKSKNDVVADQPTINVKITKSNESLAAPNKAANPDDSKGIADILSTIEKSVSQIQKSIAAMVRVGGIKPKFQNIEKLPTKTTGIDKENKKTDGNSPVRATDSIEEILSKTIHDNKTIIKIQEQTKDINHAQLQTLKNIEKHTNPDTLDQHEKDREEAKKKSEGAVSGTSKDPKETKSEDKKESGSGGGILDAVKDGMSFVKSIKDTFKSISTGASAIGALFKKGPVGGRIKNALSILGAGGAEGGLAAAGEGGLAAAGEGGLAAAGEGGLAAAEATGEKATKAIGGKNIKSIISKIPGSQKIASVAAKAGGWMSKLIGKAKDLGGSLAKGKLGSILAKYAPKFKKIAGKALGPLLSVIMNAVDLYGTVKQVKDEAANGMGGEGGAGMERFDAGKDKIGKAIIKGLMGIGGSALGGFLGTFIPVPGLGTIIGSIGGDYVGKMVGDMVGNMLGGKGVYNTLEPLLKPLGLAIDTDSMTSEQKRYGKSVPGLESESDKIIAKDLAERDGSNPSDISRDDIENERMSRKNLNFERGAIYREQNPNNPEVKKYERARKRAIIDQKQLSSGQTEQNSVKSESKDSENRYLLTSEQQLYGKNTPGIQSEDSETIAKDLAKKSGSKSSDISSIEINNERKRRHILNFQAAAKYREQNPDDPEVIKDNKDREQLQKEFSSFHGSQGGAGAANLRPQPKPTGTSNEKRASSAMSVNEASRLNQMEEDKAIKPQISNNQTTIDNSSQTYLSGSEFYRPVATEVARRR
jgi:hypothetical protein